MFKEISARMVIFLVLIIVACLIYKYLPSPLKNAKAKAILTIATTLLGVIPSLSNPFFNDNSEESNSKSSQSDIVTTAEITTAAITTNKSVPSLTTTKTTAIAVTEAPTEKSGKTYRNSVRKHYGNRRYCIQRR